jgi:hypothetical protein
MGDEPNWTPDSTMMNVPAAVPAPRLFAPHPNFSDEVNRNIIQSEIEGGIHLDDLAEGAVLEVETQHHWYTLVKGARGQVLISGHRSFARSPCRSGSRDPPGAAPCSRSASSGAACTWNSDTPPTLPSGLPASWRSERPGLRRPSRGPMPPGDGPGFGLNGLACCNIQFLTTLTRRFTGTRGGRKRRGCAARPSRCARPGFRYRCAGRLWRPATRGTCGWAR